MRHICNAVSSVCKAQASHFATDVEPRFGIWVVLFFGLRAADGGAGDWGSFGSWRNSQTRIIIRLLLSHSRQTTDLQWAIIWAIYTSTAGVPCRQWQPRRSKSMADRSPPFRLRPTNQTSLHLPRPRFHHHNSSSRKELEFSFLSSSLDQHPSSSCPSCRALDQLTHHLDRQPSFW